MLPEASKEALEYFLVLLHVWHIGMLMKGVANEGEARKIIMDYFTFQTEKQGCYCQNINFYQEKAQ